MTGQPLVEGAQHTDFPLENLPFGVFSTSEDSSRRIGVALGNHVVDVRALQQAGLFSGPHMSAVSDCLQQSTLNSFMSYGPAWWHETRVTLQRLLSSSEGALRDNEALRARALIPQESVTMHLPAEVGDYTDFYISKHHAFNVGRLFRGPGNELQPNWLHLPVGYHGRASSIVPSGHDVRRPWGQRRSAPDSTTPVFGPSVSLDFELELGALIGPGNTLGEPIPMDRAEGHLFGYVLLNDWSARDIQSWEYVPLGPFNGKNFCTQISPWVVTHEALQPFLTDPPTQEPPPLPYLTPPTHTHNVMHDIELTADIVPTGSKTPMRVTSTNYKYMYWTFMQMVSHHTAGGCNLRPGDLLGSGTLSGPEFHQRACLLELTSAGKQPLQLEAPGVAGCTRTYLQDGDEVVIRGVCRREGVGYRVGFGECRARVLPAHTQPPVAAVGSS